MHLISEEIERISGYPATDFIENRRAHARVGHPSRRPRPQSSETIAAAIAAGVRSSSSTASHGRGESAGCSSAVSRRSIATASEWLDGIIFDITERRAVEEAAARARDRGGAVSSELEASRRRIVEAGDEARRRSSATCTTARSRFVCARMTLGPRSGWRRRAGSRRGAAGDDARASGTGLYDLRDLARGIHPAQLAAAGVGAAIGTLQSRAPIPITLVDEMAERLPSDVEAALYFSCAEAIADAVKHSGAETIFVRLGRIDGSVFADVVDDGAGGASLDGGTGLRGLSDRVAALSGTVSVDSPPGVGTRLTVRIPAAG